MNVTCLDKWKNKPYLKKFLDSCFDSLFYVYKRFLIDPAFSNIDKMEQNITHQVKQITLFKFLLIEYIYESKFD